jgi:hypothetical protein
VPDVADLPPVRASFIAAAYGGFLGRTEAEYLADLRDAERRLDSSAADYGRVVLWFEHDSYDQLVLARCLAHFAAGARPAYLELICIDRHPDVPHFIGLGQLDPAALAALWPSRTAVTAGQLALGQAVWAALRQPDPSALMALMASGTPELPVMAKALRRHLQELPGVGDWLSLTQRLVLTIAAEAPVTIGRLFGALMQGREPLPFLGDVMLLPVVEAMALTTPPVIDIAPAEKPFQRLVTVTQTGRDVLAGTVDYLTLRPAERWVGGVRVAPGVAGWRWDAAAGTVVGGRMKRAPSS